MHVYLAKINISLIIMKIEKCYRIFQLTKDQVSFSDFDEFLIYVL